MKPVRKVDSTSQSCSCTSCPYKSESEQLSIRRYIARGSRISRLYFGKYIPLRERKLLNRLVRTRAVYDDLRARLISDSTLSLDKKADLRPGRQHHVIKPIDSQKSGAILEIVDIIDKGASLDPKKISDCCSCCSCSSKSKIKERNKKGPRRKKADEQAYEEEFNEIKQIVSGEGVYAKTYEKKYGKTDQFGPGEEMYVRTYEKKYGKSGQAGTGEGRYAKKYEKKFGKTGQTGTGEGMLRVHEKIIGKTGQTGTGEGFYETFEREFGKTAPRTMGERYNKKGVRFKAKRIRSEPCTCTFKFSGLIKKHSKAMFRKNHPLPLQEPFLDIEELNVVEKSKKQNLARKSMQKYNELRNKLDHSMKKINESKANMKKNLKLRAKKSLEQVKQAKNKIKSNIESGVRKSIQAVKGLRPKEQVFETIEYPEAETNFKIKKDSIVKFKDYLKRKEMMKDWECDLECKPDVCVPEQCLKIIKLRRKRKPSGHRARKYGAKYEMIQREVRVGGAPLSKSSSAVQAKQLAITTATHTKKHKPMSNVKGKKQVMAKRVVLESKEQKNEGMEKGVIKIAEKSQAPHVIPIKLGESSSQKMKKKRHIHRENKTLKGRQQIGIKSHARGRQAVRIESSFSFGLEFSKKPRQTTTSRSSVPSDINMHAPRHSRKKVRRRHESNVTSKSSLESSQGTPDNFKTNLVQTDKYERPSISLQQRRVRSKDSQCECKRRLSNVKTNTNYVTKSVSSVTRNVATSDKNTSKEVKQRGRLSQRSLLPPTRPDALTSEINESYSHNKQAVRIGSTFSFSLEFYKKGAQNEISPLKAPFITEKLEVTRSKNRQVGTKLVKTRSKNRQAGRRLMQVKGTSAKAYNEAKDTLRRCFCTLKFQVQAKTKKKTKKTKKKQNIDKKSETEPQLPYMIDKYAETKKYRYEPPKLYPQLLPYECEPGICIPDECDPILCKKIIDMRKRRNRRIVKKSTGSYTGSRKTKSTSGIISRSFASARAKTVQSSIVPMKVGYTNAPERYKHRKEDVDSNEFIKNNISASERQAVRIGSSFSFNIEFYKNKPTPTVVIANEPNLSRIAPEIKQQNKQLKYKRKDHKNRNKSIFTQVINVDKYVGPSLKKCLCTLKLYKNKVPKQKQLKKVANMTADTQTFGEVPVGEFVNKGTRTKREHHYKLLPYECEPYFCVPGECDPYLCLQRIKKRNTRNTSAFTDEPEMRSISSLTENSLTKSQAVLVQPKLFRKGTNMKADYFNVLENRHKQAREIFKASNSKQAVRIGSSFNFNIEFSKKMPGEVTKHPKLKQSSIDRSKMNRGITVTKVRVGHTDTQAIEPKKVNKASFVRPILKRCFCTLNLQKKTKKQYFKNKMETKYFGPEYYTVARATTANARIISHSFDNLELIEPKHKIISISTSSFLLHKFAKSYKSKNGTLKLWSSFKIPFKEAVFINSNLSMNLDIIRQLGPSKESIARYMKKTEQTFGHALIEEKTHECLKVFNETTNENVKKVTGFSQYLEQCFCTMNVQISNPRKIKNKNYKLKPYECEPGICIPGECNPYDCQKLIMKRFGRNVDKGSAIDSKSVSSNATGTARLDYKNNQIQTRVRNQSIVTVPQKYESQKLGESTQRQAVQLGESKRRQAVRIKSSFSFDLEFYKHRPQSIERYIKYDQHSTYIKNPEQMSYKAPEKGTQALKMKNNNYNRGQSAVGFVHKGTAPMKNRCFCTLKLQKKGRIPKEYTKMNYIQTKEPSITLRDIKIGTNTKKQRIPIGPYDLKSYECEPGICIPGQCDPYKCLELMKHRKHLGINTTQKDTVSFGSMTSEEKYKARAAGAPLRKHHKSTKTIKYNSSYQKDNPQIVDRSSRQAVRIGSNFSFNIEFYKDTPESQTYTDANLQKRIIPRSDSTVIQELKVRRDEAGDRRDVIISPKKKNVSHKTIITDKPINQKAATTEPLKRFISTKDLHSVKFLNQQNQKSFKNKCFCVLGLHRKGKKKHQAIEQLQTQAESVKKVVETAEKPTNTNIKNKIHFKNLESYECEPGICIPGQCDPYLCDKIIQQRLTKQISKKSETETVHSQSVSSGFGNYKRLKNQRTQSQGQPYQKKVQHRSKNLTPSGKVISNSDKRLVRIGSNFSFNIEIYKENVNGSANKEQGKVVRTYPIKDIKHERVHTEMSGKDSKRIGTETVNVRHNKEQIKMGPILKRCFCTLKLMNKPQKKIDGVTKGNQLDAKPAIQMKSVETQSHKRFTRLQNDSIGEVLLPYECEPNVCIPGKCDPVKCLKRIKQRKHHTKEFGTITKYPKTKSVGNVGAKTRNKHFQAKYPYTSSNKGIEKTGIDISGPIKAYNQPRQAVRIGSNFSFNIEFFKDIDNGLPKMNTEYPSEELITKKYLNKRPQYHTSTQPSRLMHNVDSQVISPKLQSAETAMAHLKRCFCTLPLRNKKLAKQKNTSIKTQSDQPKSDHSSLGNFLKKCACTLKFHKVGKQNQPQPTVVKYEIKGTATHTPRAPEYRVQKPVRILEPYECEPYTCVPGKCNPYECLKRIQRRQVRDFGTGYKRCLKDSATDSIKQPVTRSTKVQYYHKQKLNSKGTSFVSKHIRNSKEITPVSYQSSFNPNRQAVRIGSNFSFNIEFFKDNGTKNTEYKDKKDSGVEKLTSLNERGRPRTKSISTGRRRACSRISQCTNPKRRVTLSATDIAPERCFCTLKLLKKPNHPHTEGKLLSPTRKTKDKTTATKIKYTTPQDLGVYECPPLMCIPGECNPYECLEKMKRREAIKKIRNVGTRAPRTTEASVGNRPLNLRARKIQSQIAKQKNTIASTPYSEPQSEILKSHIEHSHRRNKRAVRIGSNFNFNVEFFKQKMQPAVVTVPKIVQARDNEEDLKSHLNKNVTAGGRRFGHTQMDGIKLKDQASDAGNLLKRCFCTLQLQKQHNQKMAGVKMHLPKNKPRYPQTVVVGRVAVEPYMNIKTKIIQSKNNDKARSTSTDAKLFHKTRGTKTDKKYLKNVEFPLSQCNPNSCPDYNKRISKGNDMQTILPFTPSKFYKKQSKTVVCTNNKLDRNNATGLKREITNKPIDTSTMLTKGRRRLTAKKSNKSIPRNSPELKSNAKGSFFGRCVNFFCRRAESTFQGSYNAPEPSKIIHQSEKIKFMIPPKKARSIGENCPFICPVNNRETEKRFSKLQSGDAGNSVTKSHRKSIFNNKQPKGRYGGEKFVTFADTSEHFKDNLQKSKTIKYKSDTKSRLCYSCSANDCPLKNQKLSGDFEKREKTKKSKKKAPSYSESADDCQYCACCKKKVDTDEISKGGGDRQSTISSRAKEDTGSCPCGKKPTINGTKINDSLNEKKISDKRSRKFTMTKDKCCNKIKPLLELQLDCVSHTIINKSEVEKKLEDLCISKKQVQGAKSKYQDFCTCCKCLNKHGPQEKLNKPGPKVKLKEGAAITVSAKGAKDIRGKIGKKNTKNIVLTKTPKKIRPCICGSKKCATASKINKDDKSKNAMIKLGKTCVCGSRICASETKLMKRKKKKIIHTAKSKAQLLLEKMERKELLRRTKIEDDKDEVRRRKRIARNMKLEKSVKKYKNASDLHLAIDSLTDIGKLGLSSICGTARYATKSLLDPKVACERLCRKCRKKDPETLMKQLEKDYLESDTASTMRRLKTRCLYMKRVQSIKETLENNPISHFILHIADKNPKTRIFKRKPARHIREPVDFQCSLYMATLRKRPYLSVYYKWPWFYPHFITILNIWRQFTDIMLFLLAAVVWSPCILCMEGCRALMCCFFCTG